MATPRVVPPVSPEAVHGNSAGNGIYPALVAFAVLLTHHGGRSGLTPCQKHSVLRHSLFDAPLLHHELLLRAQRTKHHGIRLDTRRGRSRLTRHQGQRRHADKKRRPASFSDTIHHAMTIPPKFLLAKEKKRW